MRVAVIVVAVVAVARCALEPILLARCCPEYELSAVRRSQRDLTGDVDTHALVDGATGGVRTRRAPPSNDRRARNFRGQTQSQYLSYAKQGDSGDTGKAEAESTHDGTRAVVATTGGMGQAQSQSGVGADCGGCVVGAVDAFGGDRYVGGRPPFQQQRPGVVGPDGRATGAWTPHQEGRNGGPLQPGIYRPGAPPGQYTNGVRPPGDVRPGHFGDYRPGGGGTGVGDFRPGVGNGDLRPGGYRPGDHRPGVGNGDPRPVGGNGDYRPGDYRPGVGDLRPAIGSGDPRPGVVNGYPRPVGGNGDYRPGDYRPGDHRPGVGNGDPRPVGGNGDYRPGVGDLTPGIGNGYPRPGVGNGDMRPVDGNGDYRPGDYKPGDRRPGVGNGDLRPVGGIGDYRPGDYRPGVGDPTPGIGPGVGNGYPRPGVGNGDMRPVGANGDYRPGDYRPGDYRPGVGDSRPGPGMIDFRPEIGVADLRPGGLRPGIGTDGTVPGVGGVGDYRPGVMNGDYRPGVDPGIPFRPGAGPGVVNGDYRPGIGVGPTGYRPGGANGNGYPGPGDGRMPGMPPTHPGTLTVNGDVAHPEGPPHGPGLTVYGKPYVGDGRIGTYVRPGHAPGGRAFTVSGTFQGSGHVYDGEHPGQHLIDATGQVHGQVTGLRPGTGYPTGHIPDGQERPLGPGQGTNGFYPGVGPGYAPGQGPGFGPGQGPGFGPGQGPGFGPGQGPGFGPGQGPGFGPGQGPGFGPAQGPGFGPGQGPGFGPGQVPGFGPGQGPGFGPSQGPGFGPGQGPGFGPGQEPGFGPGFVPSQGPGLGPGQGPGFGPQGPGFVPGQGPGFGPGFAPGQGPGFGPGQGPGLGPGQGPGFGPQGPGFVPGQGPGFGPGQGPGFGPGFAPGQGPGFGPGQGPGFGPGQGPGFGPMSSYDPAYGTDYGCPGQMPCQPGAGPVGHLVQNGHDTTDADADSQVQTSVQQTDKGTESSASASGRYAGGTAHAQVSGTYAGSGSFNAQAGTADANRAAQTQVSGGKEGASSSAQGRGGKGKSQAEVQLNSESGATSSNAMSGGVNQGTNTQVQAGNKGGMADAQASGIGHTSSQAQIGFQPYNEDRKDDDGGGGGDVVGTPFRGGGTASAQGGTYTGQSQSQITGKFRYGISYTGAAQAGSGTAESIDRARNQDRPHSLIGYAAGNSSMSDFTGFVPPDRSKQDDAQPAPVAATYGKDDGHVKPDPADRFYVNAHPHDTESSVRSSKHTPVDAPSKVYPQPESDPATTLTPPDDDDDYEYEEDDYESTVPPELVHKMHVIDQSGPKQSQSVDLGPLEDIDAHVVQDADGMLREGTLLMPGQSIPGSPGYVIPQGFRGRVTSTSGGVDAVARGGASQAQSVRLTSPGVGRIVYGAPSAARRVVDLTRGHRPDGGARDAGDSYVTVTKSIAGEIGGGRTPTDAKKYTHTYYTKSSTCGYFTFSCNIVYGTNGRTKICRPKAPTNPDGTPMQC